MNQENFTVREAEPKARSRKFFQLSMEEKAALKKRIEKFGGLVQIFIHPDFEDYIRMTEKRGEREYAQKAAWADQAFRKILAARSDRVPPIFIFEQERTRRQFEEKERKLAETAGQDIYFIRTEYVNPHPLSEELEDTYVWNVSSIEPEDQAKNWDTLIAELKNLGIKEILIGGGAFAVDKEKGLHAGCLAIALRKLSDFKTRLSTITWPDGPKELQA